MKKKIPGSNYSITENGEVINEKTGKVLRHGRTSSGYHTVKITIDKVNKTRKVHILMARYLLGHIPNYSKCVNYIDGNKNNLNIKNLKMIKRI